MENSSSNWPNLAGARHHRVRYDAAGREANSFTNLPRARCKKNVSWLYAVDLDAFHHLSHQESNSRDEPTLESGNFPVSE